MSRAALGLCLAATACGHGVPFAEPDHASDQPRYPGEPARLTYAAGRDAQFLPDGRAIVYTGVRPDLPYPAPDGLDPQYDDCLAFLPPTGGRRRRDLCQPGLPQRDTVDALEAAAVSPGGRLVYQHSWKRVLDKGWYWRELVLTSLDRPDARRRLMYVPQFGMPAHFGVSQVQWLDEDRLVYRAEGPCIGCPASSAGLFVMLLDLRSDPPAATVVPGTVDVTGLAVRDPSTLWYTLAGDTRVFAQDLRTGSTSVIRDFGPGVVPLSVQARGHRLVALVPAHSTALIAVVDLAGGATRWLTTGGVTFRRIALAPDGASLVGETLAPSAIYLLHLPTP